jgi:hypothetical protein
MEPLPERRQYGNLIVLLTQIHIDSMVMAKDYFFCRNVALNGEWECEWNEIVLLLDLEVNLKALVKFHIGKYAD